FTIFVLFVFFFTVTPPTGIYPLPLHDALPISAHDGGGGLAAPARGVGDRGAPVRAIRIPHKLRGAGSPADLREADVQSARVHAQDRKSTRLNSSHDQISYAVFCLKKKKKSRKK